VNNQTSARGNVSKNKTNATILKIVFTTRLHHASCSLRRSSSLRRHINPCNSLRLHRRRGGNHLTFYKKDSMTQVIIFLMFIGVNAGIAFLNNEERLANIADKITTQVNHVGWTVVYLGLMVMIILTVGLVSRWPLHVFEFLGSAILFQRLSIFPVFYNLFAKLPPFNLSRTTTALTDQLLVDVGFKNSAFINILMFVLSLGFLYLAI
jgi:hypothetical protein